MIENKIQDLRKKHNLSQEELAEKIGVARQTISKWELGETSPDLKQAKKIADIFNVNLDELTSNDKIINDSYKSKSQKSNFNFGNIIKLFFIYLGAIFTLTITICLIITFILFSIACLVCVYSLITNINLGNIIPTMPYWCGFIIAICLLTLSGLSIICVIWLCFIFKYIIYLIKIFKNKILKKNLNINKPILKSRKKLRIITIILAICFIALLIISLITCMINADTISFWHKWQWFNYNK